MLNYSLQIAIDFWSIMPLVISLITAGVLIASLLIQRNQIKQSEDAQYFEILRKTMEDLHKLYQIEDKLETKNECQEYAERLLNILSILAHLNNNGKISDDILKFIKFDLSYAKKIMEWYDGKNLGESNPEDIWSNLDKYFKDHKVKASNAELPEPLKKFDEL